MKYFVKFKLFFSQQIARSRYLASKSKRSLAIGVLAPSVALFTFCAFFDYHLHFYENDNNKKQQPQRMKPMLLAKSASSIEENEQQQLISVHLFTRHGARTPYGLVYGLNENDYKPELLETYVKANYSLRSSLNDEQMDGMSQHDKRSFEKPLRGSSTIPRGQLTSVGEQQLFELGRRLRRRYIDELAFLSATYNPDEIYTRSTHFRRTINSAKSLLAGLYLNSHEDQPIKPFIIHTQDTKHDELYLDSSCPEGMKAFEFFSKFHLFTDNKDYLENLKELNKVLKEMHVKNRHMSFTFFRDDLAARKAIGLPVPEHLEELYEKSNKYANMELTASSTHNIKLSVGRLVHIIKTNIETIITALAAAEDRKHDEDEETKQEDAYHKFRYYSAHDTTINALLIALNIEHKNHSWPPFGADLLIELWKQRDKMFVRIFYCGELVELFDFHDGDDHFRCSVTDFLRILQKTSIEKHEFETMCQQSADSL